MTAMRVTRATRGSMLAGAVVVVALLACKDGEDQGKAEAEGAGAPSGKASAAAEGAKGKAAPAPPAVKLDPIAEASAEAGEASNGVWTPAFKFRRDDGDGGKNYLAAADFCGQKDRMLCSETQWIKACTANATVGTLESWTASWDGDQVIVRGGKSCDDRKTVAGGSTAPARVALCCERAIGIKTKNKNSAFLKSAHAHQIKYENAYNAGNVSKMASVWYTGVVMDGTMTAKATLQTKQEQWFKKYPKRWMLFDVCEVSLGDVLTGEGKTMYSPGLVHDCNTISVLGDEVTVVMTEFGRYRGYEEKVDFIRTIKHHSRTRKLGKL